MPIVTRKASGLKLRQQRRLVGLCGLNQLLANLVTSLRRQASRRCCQRINSLGHPWQLVLLLCFLCCATGHLQAAPIPTVSASAYRAQLQNAEAALHRMEQSPPRLLKNILQNLVRTQKVQRADGQQMTVNDDEWQRRLNDLSGNATRDQVRQAHQAVTARLRALDEWTNPRWPGNSGTGYFQPHNNVQNIMRQLEETGQIRTGPTQAQQMWSSVTKWIKGVFQRLLKWLDGLFPSAPAGKVKPMNIDPKLIWIIFTATVLAMLAVIGYFVWRAVGGRLGKRGARREVRFLDGEDAELLRLPPDELTERARQFAQDGNYGEALRHLYIALLLRLDARGVWRYNTRRTNWEHIAELRADATRAPLVRPLSDITRRFDRVRYGNARCSSEDWIRFERDVEAVQNSAPISTSPDSATSQSSPAGARL